MLHKYAAPLGVLAALVGILSVVNWANPTFVPQVIKQVALVAGDSSYSPDQPKKGYVYVCNSKYRTKGLPKTGSWIGGKSFNLKDKVAVKGEVLWASNVSIAETGNRRLIASNGLPKHPTGSFPIDENSPAFRYDYNEYQIKAQDLVYDFPKNPTIEDDPICVGNEVGVAINGVPLFNPLNEFGLDAVARNMLDNCDGAPDEAGIYHYYNVSRCLEKNASSTEADIIGYALDGFPIVRDFSLDNSDLDVCHGQMSEIQINGEKRAVYHYVATADFPYLVGCFRGKPIIEPTLEIKKKAEVEAEAIPQYYNSQEKLVLPYLRDIHEGSNTKTKSFEFNWRDWAPSFTQ